jgi:hypothetical protein
MLIIGAEICFQVGRPAKDIVTELYLKYMGMEKTGLRMTGYLPHLWERNDQGITGPQLFNKRFIFQVVDFDYSKNTLWLREMASCIGKSPALPGEENRISEEFLLIHAI